MKFRIRGTQLYGTTTRMGALPTCSQDCWMTALRLVLTSRRARVVIQALDEDDPLCDRDHVDEHRARVKGPYPAKHKMVRWPCVDLREEVARRSSVTCTLTAVGSSLTTRTVGTRYAATAANISAPGAWVRWQAL